MKLERGRSKEGEGEDKTKQKRRIRDIPINHFGAGFPNSPEEKVAPLLVSHCYNSRDEKNRANSKKLRYYGFSIVKSGRVARRENWPSEYLQGEIIQKEGNSKGAKEISNFQHEPNRTVIGGLRGYTPSGCPSVFTSLSEEREPP